MKQITKLFIFSLLIVCASFQNIIAQPLNYDMMRQNYPTPMLDMQVIEGASMKIPPFQTDMDQQIRQQQELLRNNIIRLEAPNAKLLIPQEKQGLIKRLKVVDRKVTDVLTGKMKKTLKEKELLHKDMFYLNDSMNKLDMGQELNENGIIELRGQVIRVEQNLSIFYLDTINVTLSSKCPIQQVSYSSSNYNTKTMNFNSKSRYVSIPLSAGPSWIVTVYDTCGNVTVYTITVECDDYWFFWNKCYETKRQKH